MGVRRRKIKLNVVVFTRQIINWWLGYVLSQPVDIDLSVFGYFVRSYLGYTFVSENTKKFYSLIPYRSNATEAADLEKVAA